MLFRQLFDSETSTFTYLLADQDSGEAVIIDPVLEQVARDFSLIQELDLKLTHILETHVHADHITGSGQLRALTGAQIVVPFGAGVSLADIYVKQADKLTFGRHQLEVLETPGHTETCISWLLRGEAVFTGDALLIRGTGRSDFQGGSSATLYDSITLKLFSLDENTRVFPCHDYRGRHQSTIAEEKRFNPRVANKTKLEFVDLMEHLDLALPRKIHEAVPGNQVCGLLGALPSELEQEVSVDWVHDHRDLVQILDTRMLDEYHQEPGHIKGALQADQSELPQKIKDLDRSRALVTVCRSGRRSLNAVEKLRAAGFTRVWSMAGGMLEWRKHNFPTQL